MPSKYLVIFCKYFVNNCGITYEFIEAVSKSEIAGKAIQRCKKIKGSQLDRVEYLVISKNDLIKKLLN